MVWILSGPGYVGHRMKSYMKYTLKNSLSVMYCNAEMIFFSDEIHAKMPQKLSKQNHTIWESCYICCSLHMQ